MTECDHVWSKKTILKEIPLFGLQEVLPCLNCSTVRLVPPPESRVLGYAYDAAEALGKAIEQAARDPKLAKLGEKLVWIRSLVDGALIDLGYDPDAPPSDDGDGQEPRITIT